MAKNLMIYPTAADDLKQCCPGNPKISIRLRAIARAQMACDLGGILVYFEYGRMSGLGRNVLLGKYH